MTLVVDIDAIASNAAAVLARARQAGYELSAVIKRAYSRPTIVDAVLTAGIDRFSVSTVDAARAIPGAFLNRTDLIGLVGPTQARLVHGRFAGSQQTITALVSALAASEGRPHLVWLGVRTTDAREGMDLDEVSARAREWKALCRGPIRLRGLMANWGCRHTAPPEMSEIDRLDEIVEILRVELNVADFGLSLGGSVILSQLWQRKAAPMNDQLRVGEAIFAGTIPGGFESGLDLRRPFGLDVQVVDARQSDGGGQRLIVDRGTSAVDWRDVRIPGLARYDWYGATDMSVLEIQDGLPRFRIGQRIRIELGYHSAARSLLNSAIRMKTTNRRLREM